MEKLDFNENQSVFRVGESSDKMFLLVKGKVGIFLPKNETKDADFFVEENELFGEMGVIDNELRSASARCVTESTVIAITKKEFDEQVNSSNIFVKACLAALSHRLRQANKKI